MKTPHRQTPTGSRPLRLRCEAPGRRPFTVTLDGARADAVRDEARRRGVTEGEAFRALVLAGLAIVRGSVPV